MLLTIACSTWNNRITDAWDVYNRAQQQTSAVRFMFVHQVDLLSADSAFTQHDAIKSIQKAASQNDLIQYIASNSKGITVSRNIAIKHCKTRFIWFIDDDLIFLPNAIDKILNIVSSPSKAHVYLFESNMPNAKPRAIYPSHLEEPNDKAILRVASFEIIADCYFIKANNVTFDESMGLGSDTNIPMGEEPVFLASVRRAGGKLIHHKLAVLVHPEISTGRIVNERNFYAKGVAIKRCFERGTRLRFLLRDIYRLLRNSRNEFGAVRVRIKLIKSLIDGYVSNGLSHD